MKAALQVLCTAALPPAAVLSFRGKQQFILRRPATIRILTELAFSTDAVLNLGRFDMQHCAITCHAVALRMVSRWNIDVAQW